MEFLVHHLLERAAARHPDRPAVVDGGSVVPYAELDARANRVASLLAELGVARGDRVGVHLDKSADAVAAVYGVLKAGAAYVPLDPSAPAARLGGIAADCGTRVLLTGSRRRDAWTGMVEAGAPIEALVVLDDAAPAADAVPAPVRVLGAADVDARAPEPPARPTIDLDLAYVLYTSGSTGRPKGVMLTHRNALAFVAWAAEEFGVGPDDRLSSHAPLHFDLSVFDLFAAAAGAAAVVLVPARASVFPSQLAAFVDEQRISVWYSVPSLLAMLVERGGLRPGALPTLRTVLFAGEVFPVKYLRRLMRLVPHARFANLYGPTETNVCTWYEVPPLDDDRTEPVPIGRAVANDEVLVVTDDGRRAAPGEAGELYVRGATVMRGYWGDPERTARALVVDPLAEGVADPAYRTGDLVQEDHDGNLRYLGRRDAQVKSRGYRIELGDVEAALYAHADVEHCAVVAVPDELVTNRLLAYVVGRRPITGQELAAFVAGRLPRYMVPETFVTAEALPTTSTGKIDRQALVAQARSRGVAR